MKKYSSPYDIENTYTDELLSRLERIEEEQEYISQQIIDADIVDTTRSQFMNDVAKFKFEF